MTRPPRPFPFLRRFARIRAWISERRRAGMLNNIKADILIIGAGPAGLTAALYAARAGKTTVVLEGRAASRMALGYEIENYPGFPSVNSLELLGKFMEHARRFGARIVTGDAIALGLD
ncbi:MAG TPA: FAD-binding protein, partial [Acidobacteriota bacterium]|nr:FAD-binding protein [Acidobacteriota bacterium]